MLQEARQNKIYEILSIQGQVSVDQIVNDFSVSRETARRDLMEMEQAGFLRRIRGGAMSLPRNDGPPISVRITQRINEKRAICMAALKLLKNGDTIYLDTGSTSSIMAALLAGPTKLTNLTIITNSFDVANNAIKPSSEISFPPKVILLGGSIKSDPMETYGSTTINDIYKYHADVALLAPWSITLEKGAMNLNVRGAEIAAAMIKNSNKRIILADHSKLDSSESISFCAIKEIDHLIVDAKACKNKRFEKFQQQLSNLIVA